MKLKLIVAGIALASLLPVSATYAQEKKAAGSGPNPFSDCGIGAALFPKIPVAAVISNIIWDIGTTAVISATASPETCQGKNVAAAAFILESYASLVEETARGQGEHLTALLNILEVEDSARADVVSSIRTQMSEHVAGADYVAADQVEKSSTYYNSVMVALDSDAA